MPNLLQALRDAPPAQILEALQALETERTGITYDVGSAILGANPSREFDGPDPWACSTPDLDRGTVYVTGFVQGREMEAVDLPFVTLGNSAPSEAETFIASIIIRNDEIIKNVALIGDRNAQEMRDYISRRPQEFYIVDRDLIQWSSG